MMNFAKAVEKVTTFQNKKTFLISSALDWQMLVAVGRQLKCPAKIIQDSSRYDYLYGKDHSSNHIRTNSPLGRKHGRIQRKETWGIITHRRGMQTALSASSLQTDCR